MTNPIDALNWLFKHKRRWAFLGALTLIVMGCTTFYYGSHITDTGNDAAETFIFGSLIAGTFVVATCETFMIMFLFYKIQLSGSWESSHVPLREMVAQQMRSDNEPHGDVHEVRPHSEETRV
jgi:hypothetical protein